VGAKKHRLPRQHDRHLKSTNTVQRLNGKIKHRADVIGIFPNESAIRRLVGADRS
jgi:putative transposase